MPGVLYGAIPRPTAAQRAQGPLSLSELRAVTDPTQVASRLYNRMIAEPVQFAANLGRQAMTDPNWGYTPQGEVDPEAVKQSMRAAGMAMTGSVPASMLEPAGWEPGMMAGAGLRTPKRARTLEALDEVQGGGSGVSTPAILPERTPPLRLFDPSAESGGVPPVAQTPIPRYEPPRGVPQRTLDLTANQNVRDKMLEYIKRGQQMGGEQWYGSTRPILEDFRSVLGPEEGAAANQRWWDYQGAASPQSKVPESTRNASYYYSLERQGQPMPEVGTQNPAPYGHFAQKLHQLNAQRINQGTWDVFNNPKPPSFAANLAGNWRPGTIDLHAMRAPAILSEDPRFLITDYQAKPTDPKFNVRAAVESGALPMSEAVKEPGYWVGQPAKNEYGAMEKYYGDLARAAGLDYGQGLIAPTQASGWVGAGELTGLGSDASKTALDFTRDRVMRTAEYHGMDPNDVWANVIRGKMALRAGGPAGAVAGGVASRAAADRPRPTAEESQRALEAFLAAGGA